MTNRYSQSHVSDRVPLRNLATAVAAECADTAVVVAHIAGSSGFGVGESGGRDNVTA